MGADKAGPSSLKDGILVCWGTLVVGLAPDEVPDGGNQNDSGKNDGGVVHRGRGDGEVGGHAEEGSRKRRPGYETC